MSEETVLEAPAKVNLSLRVLKRRDDGFHEIITRMAPVTLTDRLTFRHSPGTGFVLTCDDESLPRDEENLVVRAARALEKVARRSFDVEVHLQKRIPRGAGLGGGSSDAATTLAGLNDFLGLGLSRKKLLNAAASLGSDIPFFLHDAVCDCGGRGEKVEPVEFGTPLSLILIKPAFPVETPWAYQNWRDSRELPGVLYAPQICPWGEMVNDLERPVFQKHLVLADMKMWLLDQPEVHAALMSGSGSTLMAVLREARHANDLEDRIREEYGEETWTCQCATVSGNGGV